MKRHSPEEELFALKLAYHALGKYAGLGGKSANEKSLASPHVAGKLMREIRAVGEKLQRKIGTNGDGEARKAVNALEKKPELCLEVEKHFSGKEKITDDDVNWLIHLADKTG